MPREASDKITAKVTVKTGNVTKEVEYSSTYDWDDDLSHYPKSFLDELVKTAVRNKARLIAISRLEAACQTIPRATWFVEGFLKSIKGGTTEQALALYRNADSSACLEPPKEIKVTAADLLPTPAPEVKK